MVEAFKVVLAIGMIIGIIAVALFLLYLPVIIFGIITARTNGLVGGASVVVCAFTVAFVATYIGGPGTLGVAAFVWIAIPGIFGVIDPPNLPSRLD